VAANLTGQEARPCSADVVDRGEQSRQRVDSADSELHSLFHARLARTTSLGHRPVLPACPPGDLPPGWCRGGDPAAARILTPARRPRPS